MFVFILIAPNFDEEAVIYCLCRMRQKKLSVTLVGHVSGPLSGLHGVKLEADRSLTQIERIRFTPKHLILIPGSSESVNRLLSDPRVHNLINTVLAAKGFVATMSSAQESFAHANLSKLVETEPHYLQQGNKETANFISELINYVSS